MSAYTDIITAARLACKSTDPERQRSGREWLRQLVAGLDEAPAADQWRMLQEGELIQAGDEYEAGANDWRPTGCVGETLNRTSGNGNTYHFLHRRRIVQSPAVPDGIPNPPDGFTYYGRGPLKERNTETNLDVAWLSPHLGWRVADSSGSAGVHYALRTGSEIAKANGLP